MKRKHKKNFFSLTILLKYSNIVENKENCTNFLNKGTYRQCPLDMNTAHLVLFTMCLRCVSNKSKS